MYSAVNSLLESGNRFEVSLLNRSDCYKVSVSTTNTIYYFAGFLSKHMQQLIVYRCGPLFIFCSGDLSLTRGTENNHKFLLLEQWSKFVPAGPTDYFL
jgi:hypothetical protein